MPYDVAFTLPPEDVAAYGIVFGEFAGNTFDVNSMSWVKTE